MKKVLVNYGGAILLYVVIFFGVIAISTRMNYLDYKDSTIMINK